jgi:uncharacterized membrane protein
MESIPGLLKDSRFWAAVILLGRVTLPHLGVVIPEDVWKAIEGLIDAILGSILGGLALYAARARYLKRKHIDITLPQ